MRHIELEFISAAPSVGNDYKFADFSVSVEGGGLFLFIHNEDLDRLYGRSDSRSGASILKSNSGERPPFILVHVIDGLEIKYEFPAIDVAYPHFDVFPNGKILLAGARCGWKNKNDYDRNGNIIDPVTGDVKRILLGDGIQDLCIDKKGQIWVSYFDEGVFGNAGWGGPGPDPIGASGLNCFNATGNVVWRYPGGDIADCYALNVCKDSVFIYYYDGFPLCRIDRNFSINKWATKLRGCSTFAVGERVVLFTGQYDDESSTAYLCELIENELGSPERVQLNLVLDGPITGNKFIGRGPTLHYCDGSNWFRVNVDTI